jgi:hypothetical protein
MHTSVQEGLGEIARWFGEMASVINMGENESITTGTIAFSCCQCELEF